MKNLSLYGLTALMLFAVMPVQVHAITNTMQAAVVEPKPSEAEIAEILMARLTEIKGMGHSALTASEKRALRKEVRQIRSELKTLSSGIYISVGAIIIILLLLLLLL